MSTILFPVIFSSTSFGICILAASISALLAVNVYTFIDNPEWAIFSGLSVVGLIVCFFLKEKAEKPNEV